MARDSEEGKAKLEDLANWYSSRKAKRNEATTRLHLVDCLFLDCLGWDRDDVTAEEQHAGKFVDYVFRTTRAVLIVEAKKEGDYFELPAGKRRPIYSIRGLRDSCSAVRDALDQVMGYCQNRGVQYGVITNGHQIVAVLAARNDGVPPRHGKALVFQSIECMTERFSQLWNVLSKSGVQENRLTSMLMATRRASLPGKLSATLMPYPGIKDRNIVQTDMQIISETVMEDIPRAAELEGTFLRECYCQSGALSQHSLLSKHVLSARYSALFSADRPHPSVVSASDKSGLAPEMLARSYSKRPVLLIGDVGTGKTMFLRNLIVNDARLEVERSIALYLNLGVSASFLGSAELKNFILEEIRQQLRQTHDVDICERSFLRGVYNLDLIRFQKGLYGELKDLAPDRFKEKEIVFLEGLIENREEHIKRSLEHLEKARLKQIVIFLDNIDQRDGEIQEAAFLIAHEMADRWPATVFLALRPETFGRSNRAGVLSGYHAKAFTIAPPRMDRVIEKRLAFALMITRGDIEVRGVGETVDRSFATLESMLRVFAYSIDTNRSLVECIDNIASGNVRLGLDLIRQFFGSGHVDTAKIIEIYERGENYRIPLHEFLRAIIYGDGVHYDPQSSPIVNLFDISWEDKREHFLLPAILVTLRDANPSVHEHGFLENAFLYDRLQECGYIPAQIDFALRRAHDGKVIEYSGRETGGGVDLTRLSFRITSLGSYHISRLVCCFQYIDAIVVDTPILDQNVRSRINDEKYIKRRLRRADIFREYLDLAFESCNISPSLLDWDTISKQILMDTEEIGDRLEETRK